MKNKRNQGNRLLTICMVLLLAFSMLFTAVETTENVQAASNGLSAYKKITFYKSGKVNGTIYSMKYNDRTNRYIVYASKNGKKKALLNSCSSGSIVTNGKYLYYESAAFLRSGSLQKTETGTVQPENPQKQSADQLQRRRPCGQHDRLRRNLSLRGISDPVW